VDGAFERAIAIFPEPAREADRSAGSISYRLRRADLRPGDAARRRCRHHRTRAQSAERPDANAWIDYWLRINKEINPPTERAIRIPTGVGKTRITVEEVVEWIRDVKAEGAVIYAVPRHKLGRKIEEQFTAHGSSARVFRGRKADDPENAGTSMCLNLPAVELALSCHANVTETCCRYKEQRCRYFDRCGYQRQMPDEGEKVDVWIVASDTLFHTQEVFGEPVAVIIDEAIWRKGLRGVEELEWSVPISSLISPQLAGRGAAEAGGERRRSAAGLRRLRHY
jgi:hypothetical protein